MVWVMVAITPILNSCLDHVAALQRQLLRQVGDGDRIADGDLADHLGRTGEAVLESGAAARSGRAERWRCFGLPRVLALLLRRARSEADRCNWPAKRAVLSSSSTLATIACEPRCAVLPFWRRSCRPVRARVPAWDGRGGRERLARGGIADSSSGRGFRGGQARSARPPLLRQRLRSAISSARLRSFGQPLLFGLVALARFGQLAHGSRPLGIVDRRRPRPGLTRVTFLRTTTSIVLGPRSCRRRRR
jgi:hypothetical protein